MQCCSSNGALQEDRAIDRRHIRRLAQIAEKYKQKAKEKDTTKVLKHEVCVKTEAAVVAVGEKHRLPFRSLAELSELGGGLIET